jgi:hypothetical protein
MTGDDRKSVVARDRIELSTFRFSGGRSYRLSYLALTVLLPLILSVLSGPDGIRTRDLRLDRAA